MTWDGDAPIDVKVQFDGPDSFKVQKPPMMSPSVNVAIMHEDWSKRSGAFAQDIRSPGGNKSWDVIVGSDQVNANVTFSWDQLRTIPRNVRLLLKDQSNGQTVDMRTRSSISFNTGDTAAGRRFLPRAETTLARRRTSA